MAVERRLTEIVGPVGGKLHTARSRNDQVATDMAMFTRAHALRAIEALTATCRPLIVPRGGGAPGLGRCPATRTCSARSRCLSGHSPAGATSGCSGATRRGSRLRVWAARAELPLGAGALAGRELPDRTAAGGLRSSGFAGVGRRTRSTAVSNRDFVLDYLSAAPTCATHLTRLGAEIVLWSSEEFGFAEVDDDWASASSIMPQKKNPDRGRAAAREGAARSSPTWPRCTA